MPAHLGQYPRIEEALRNNYSIS